MPKCPCDGQALSRERLEEDQFRRWNPNRQKSQKTTCPVVFRCANSKGDNFEPLLRYLKGELREGENAILVCMEVLISIPANLALNNEDVVTHNLYPYPALAKSGITEIRYYAAGQLGPEHTFVP